MASRYDHDIAAWRDGTGKLPDDEYRVYHVILDLIYQHDGAISMNEVGLAGACNQHRLRFRGAFARLVEKGKLILRDDGKVTNLRAEKELRNIADRRRKKIPTLPQPPAHPGGVGEGLAGGQPSKPLKTAKQKSVPVRSGPDLLSPNGDSTAAKPRKPKSERSRLPSDALLNEAGLAYAIVQGFSSAEAYQMFDRFRDYHQSRGNLMADWDAAWRTWVRNQVDFKKRDGGQNGRVQAAGNGGRGSYATATARLRASIERQGAGDYADHDAAGHGPSRGH